MKSLFFAFFLLFVVLLQGAEILDASKALKEAPKAPTLKDNAIKSGYGNWQKNCQKKICDNKKKCHKYDCKCDYKNYDCNCKKYSYDCNCGFKNYDCNCQKYPYECKCDYHSYDCNCHKDPYDCNCHEVSYVCGEQYSYKFSIKSFKNGDKYPYSTPKYCYKTVCDTCHKDKCDTCKKKVCDTCYRENCDTCKKKHCDTCFKEKCDTCKKKHCKTCKSCERVRICKYKNKRC